ncbi:MAG: dipeptidase [Planctomycetes bacterium]|nr:dipeptidase [Planctomycetota bacterium]MCB9868468.1 membrane dipeptidase [Planctomycetota bacterium]
MARAELGAHVSSAALAAVLLCAAPAIAQARADAAEPEAALVARAKAIHEAVFTIDTHKDIDPGLATASSSADPEEVARYRRKHDPTVDGDNQVDFPKMRAGGYDGAFYIVFVAQGDVDPAGFHRAAQRAKLMFDAIHRMVDRYPQHIELALSPADVRRIHHSGKLVACIGIENGYPMGKDLSRIEHFYRRGARYMGIAHNGHNQLGDSHQGRRPGDEPLHGGLSELGRKAIAEMNRLGIMVDISHSAKTTMLQALAVSKAPVIASHSGCAAVRAHGRNLDDEQLDALKRNGGVIQIVALGAFVKDDAKHRAALDAARERLGVPSSGKLRELRRNGPLPSDLQAKLLELQKARKAIDAQFPPGSVRDFVDHIDHAVKRIGIRHVAIASDFDGGGGVVGWNNARETFHVTLELVRRGYTKEQIGAIWSGNTLRLWEEVEAVAKKLRAANGKNGK